jgi:hypothetical protein
VLTAAAMFSVANICGKVALTSGADVPSLLTFRSVGGLGLVGGQAAHGRHFLLRRWHMAKRKKKVKVSSELWEVLSQLFTDVEGMCSGEVASKSWRSGEFFSPNP